MRLVKRVQSSPSFMMEKGDPSSHGGSFPRHREAAGIERRHSYVCSFCGRELRNAQALGGHMNVHRRERALANQLVELRNNNQSGDARGAAAAAAAAASRNPPGACTMRGDPEQDVITHACDMHGGSSSSSSSPPSCPSTFDSCLVHPWTPFHPKALARRRDSVDLELRLGLAPDRF